MAKDPGDRPQSAEEFLALLEEAANKAYGLGWETGASITGLTAAAISAGGAAAGAAGTSAGVVGTQVAGTAAAAGAATSSAGGAAAAGGDAAAGGTHAASRGATGGGGVRPLIRRLGPARAAAVAVVAIVILSAGTYGASRLIPLSPSSSKTPAPTTSVAKALPAPCTLLTPDIAASVIGPDPHLLTSNNTACDYFTDRPPPDPGQATDCNEPGQVQFSIFPIGTTVVEGGASVERIPGVGDKATFQDMYVIVVKGDAVLRILAVRRRVGPCVPGPWPSPSLLKEDGIKIAVAILPRL